MRTAMTGARAITLLLGTGSLASAQQILWHVEAAAPTDGMGRAVSVGPDVSGDGVADLLVGYVYELCGTNTSGVVREFSTSSGQINGWCGATYAGNFGAPVGWLDDVDGRGAPDVIVGETSFKDPFWGLGTGRFQVLAGEDSSLLYEVVGTLQNGYFGYFAVCGDVDVDGLRDIIVGAPGYGGNAEGKVWLFSGVDGALIREHVGPSSNMYLGMIVLGVGDTDGDGIDDYAMTAALGINKGRVDVRSGRTGSLIFRLDGKSGDNIGSHIARTKDLDGDGRDDLLISRVASRDGKVEAYSPFTGALLWSVSGLSSIEYFGRPTLEVGDQNGDDVPDFLMSVIYDDHDDHDSGRVDLISGANLRRLYRFYPDATKVRFFGETLERGVDFNGDGIEDLIMGCADGGSLSKDAGVLQIRAGNDLWLQADPIAPIVGDTVVVDLRGAMTGRLGLIAVTSIDGAPTFESLLLAPFDANGELQFSADIDASLSGMEFTLMGWAQNRNGRGRLLDATPFVVTVQ